MLILEVLGLFLVQIKKNVLKAIRYYLTPGFQSVGCIL